MKKDIQLSYKHPPIDFDKVWLHLHRLGTPIYMDAYFKAWGFKKTQKYFTDYYPVKNEFEDLHLFFKKGNWYGKYNIKSFGYVMLDYFVDEKNFKTYLEKKRKLKDEIESLWKNHSQNRVVNMVPEQQLSLLDECLALMIRSFVVDPFAPMIGEMAPDYTNWWLKKKNVPEAEHKATFHLLFASDEVSETIRRHLIVKERIEGAQSEEIKQKVLKELMKDFAFAKTEFSGYLPYTEVDVLNEYNAIKSMQLHTDEEKLAKEKLLKELGANEQEKFIFYLFGYCQYSRDERKEYLQKLMAIADWCLLGLSRKYNISIDWLRSALVGELSLERLADAKYVKLLEQRYNEGIAMYWNDCAEGRYVVGEDGEKIYNSIDNKIDTNVEIKGQATFYGKATGKVKIISDPKMPVPEDPFVLVTGMTSPDFIHFMQKCVAIVTDEGGITSHAAILSRELKKPCIIGTKIARKMLKDGDMVEVDADNGIVRIL
jgi:phosphohistidine swiveling domain-containing protein